MFLEFLQQVSGNVKLPNFTKNVKTQTSFPACHFDLDFLLSNDYITICDYSNFIQSTHMIAYYRHNALISKTPYYAAVLHRAVNKSPSEVLDRYVE